MGRGEPVHRTEDGRYVVVDGRRWRATDPRIPEALRAELVAELMDARRRVRHDGPAARARVSDAKVALGERGHPWWEPATQEDLAARAAAAYRALLRHRDGTMCPSDIARIVDGQRWRPLLPLVRQVAWKLTDAGTLVVQQKGQPVGRDARGPLRVARGPQFA